MVNYYRAYNSFGVKGKKPIKIEYIARTTQKITADRIKNGIMVTLVNLRTGESSAERINLDSDIIIRYHKPLSPREVEELIYKKAEQFKLRLEKEIFG